MRGRASKGRKSPPSTVTIPVQATSVGAIPANQFTGWEHGGGLIFTRNAWGVNIKYVEPTSGATVATQTKGVSRDQEITFWASIGRVYLRIADGKALRFETNIDTGGGWSVSFVSIGSSGYESDTFIESLGSGTPSGLNTADTDGDEWVFGVSGFDVYVRWNGVEQWRAQQIWQNKPGKVGLRCIGGTSVYGFRSVSVEFKASAALHSSPEFKIIDVRDFGVVPYATTGSMTGGSATLTVASNPGFAIGDPIIVEIGGESGAGSRGTRGVGGQWPTLTYANATAMNADTSQVTAKYAGLLDTGDVYQWSGSSWVQITDDHSDKIAPKALVTTISNISGTTFTLADAATVSTTSANVYMNAAEKYAEVIGATYFQLWDYIEDFTIIWPDGEYAWGFAGGNPKGFGSNRTNWEVKGQSRAGTIFFSPDGTGSLGIHNVSWTNGVIHDMTLNSNCTTGKGYIGTYNATTDYPEFPFCNLRIETSTGTEIYNVTTNDHMQAGIATSYCTDINVHDCTIQHSTGHRAYIAWAFNFANSEICTATDITLNFDRLTCGLEQFQCTDCVFDGITTTNGICSVNSSDNWTYSNVTVTIEEDCAPTSDYNWMLTGNPAINLNSNINNQQGNGTTSQPGLLDNLHFVQQGKVQVSGTGTYPWLKNVINLNGAISDITIRGDFPAKPNTNGYIEVPAGYAPEIILDNQARNGGGTGKLRTILDGIRVKGGTASPSVIVDDPTSSVTNCVLDDYTTGGTDTDNITNAEYEAL